MPTHSEPQRMQRFFLRVTAHPRRVLAAACASMVLFAIPIPSTRFDNRPDAFIPAGHPALVAKARVEELFGLKDPMLLALETPELDGVYREAPLRLVQKLTNEVIEGLARLAAIGEIPDPGPRAVLSLATERSVEMAGELPSEAPFLDPFPTTPRALEALKASILELELYTGVLVSADGRAAAVLVHPPADHAERVHALLRDVVRANEPSLGKGERLHLAGEAAVRVAMGEAVARDGFRFNPICFVVITLFLYLAFRNLAGVVIPLLVVGASLACMLGLMALAGKPFYIITNAIPVTVMSIGVASSMHLLGEFYGHLRDAMPGQSRQEIVASACSALWRPILMTAITDVVGFASTFVSGILPPLELFGLFSALGLGACLVYAWTIVPASLMLIDPGHAAHRRRVDWAATGFVARGLRRLGCWIWDHPWLVLAAGVVAVAVGVGGAIRLRANQSMESAFREAHPVVQSNRAVNRLFQGTYFLDVLIEGDEPGDVLRPEVLRAIDGLEESAHALPDVGGSISVAGFVKKMHQILADRDPAQRLIPDDAVTIRSELGLIREHSPSKLSELHKVLTDDDLAANIRIRVSKGDFRSEAPVVEAIEPLLVERFRGLPVHARLAGRVYLDYHWMLLVLRSNVGNIALSTSLIFVCMLLLFRSCIGALLSLLPVAIAVLYTYGAMGFAGIELSVGTSMFAAIATGVGIDYPTHLLERLRTRIGLEGLEPRAAVEEALGSAGKGVLFNALAVAFGFLVLVVSELPILVDFGLMIGVGILTACASSLLLLPAIVRVVRPGFVFSPRGAPAKAIDSHDAEGARGA